MCDYRLFETHRCHTSSCAPREFQIGRLGVCVVFSQYCNVPSLPLRVKIVTSLCTVQDVPSIYQSPQPSML
jgi:hypothetical protein